MMVAAVQLACMSCTQRQRSGGDERDEAHVGGRHAVGWSGVVGIACGCGSGRKLMVAAVQLAHLSCTQRQRSGGAERDEAHVGGMRIP